MFGSVAAIGGAAGLILGGFLAQYFSWHWTLHVNLVFAVIAVAGALAWVRTRRPDARPRTGRGGAGQCRAVLRRFRFSHAASAGWTAALTIGSLVAGVVLLAGLVLAERRSPHPV